MKTNEIVFLFVGNPFPPKKQEKRESTLYLLTTSSPVKFQILIHQIKTMSNQLKSVTINEIYN